MYFTDLDEDRIDSVQAKSFLIGVAELCANHELNYAIHAKLVLTNVFNDNSAIFSSKYFWVILKCKDISVIDKN